MAWAVTELIIWGRWVGCGLWEVWKTGLEEWVGKKMQSVVVNVVWCDALVENKWHEWCCGVDGCVWLTYKTGRPRKV